MVRPCQMWPDASPALGQPPNLLGTGWCWAPKQAWEPSLEPCLSQKPADAESQPTSAHGAGWWQTAMALQLTGAGKVRPAHVSQCCSGQLDWLGLLEEAGSSLTSGRGGGSRQQPRKLEQKEATSLGRLCLLVRNRVSLPCSTCATSASPVLGVWGNCTWGFDQAYRGINKKIHSTLTLLAVGAVMWKSHGAAEKWEGKRERWRLKEVCHRIISSLKTILIIRQLPYETWFQLGLQRQ